MKNFLISFLTGILLGGGGVWYLVERDRTPGLRDIGQRAEAVRQDIGEAGSATAARAREVLDAKLEALELAPVKMREEMTRTGQVVRRKAREFGQAVAEAAADTRITAEIEAKLLRDPELSAWDVSVTTADGHVTLSGDVTSTDQIGRAILLSYETPGVREVTSILRVEETP